MRLPRRLRRVLGIASPSQLARFDPDEFRRVVKRDHAATAAVAAAYRLARAAHEDGPTLVDGNGYVTRLPGRRAVDVEPELLERMAVDAWSHTLPAGREQEAYSLWPLLPADEQRTWRRCAWSACRHLGHWPGPLPS